MDALIANCQKRRYWLLMKGREGNGIIFQILKEIWTILIFNVLFDATFLDNTLCSLSAQDAPFLACFWAMTKFKYQEWS
jgi:hypothetical protein